MIPNKIISFLFLTLALATLTSKLSAQRVYTPQNGDLLFQEANTGDFEEAIKAVTPSYMGRQLTHVATFVMVNGKPMVLEAISKGVVLTNFQDFLNREINSNGKPKVMVGRIKPQYSSIIDSSISKMMLLLNKKYDSAFDIDNDAYYCSELIYKCFRYRGEPLFTLHPMTFNDPKTGQPLDKWAAYFKELNLKIPEGEMGLNPGSVANEKTIDMIYSFY